MQAVMQGGSVAQTPTSSGGKYSTHMTKLHSHAWLHFTIHCAGECVKAGPPVSVLVAMQVTD